MAADHDNDDKMLMEYDFVAEEAEQLKADLIKIGKNEIDDIQRDNMDSDELEALEEEEKLV
jgi:hypothetical protein